MRQVLIWGPLKQANGRMVFCFTLNVCKNTSFVNNWAFLILGHGVCTQGKEVNIELYKHWTGSGACNVLNKNCILSWHHYKKKSLCMKTSQDWCLRFPVLMRILR